MKGFFPMMGSWKRLTPLSDLMSYPLSGLKQTVFSVMQDENSF